jgi:hypothetical protein
MIVCHGEERRAKCESDFVMMIVWRRWRSRFAIFALESYRYQNHEADNNDDATTMMIDSRQC